MRTLAACLLCLSLLSKASAYTSFQKLFGDAYSDQLIEVIRTSDGGYCAAGLTDMTAFDSTDLVIYRTNSTGDLLYSYRIGDAHLNQLGGLIQKSDGSFLLCGNTMGTVNDPNYAEIFLTNIDDFGNLNWSYSYGNTGTDQANGILKRWDESVIVTGSTGGITQSALIFKVDALGQLTWSTTLNVNFSSRFTKAANTSDGGVIAVGDCHNGGANSDHLVAKFDNNGTLLWSKIIYTSNQSTAEVSEDIVAAGDGGFVICGYAERLPGTDYDCCLYKIDGNGNLLWSTLVGSQDNDYGFSVLKAYNGKWLVAGQTNLAQYQNSFLFAVDSTSTIEWSYQYGTAGNNTRLNSLIYGIDGGYVACGYDNGPGQFSEGYLIKTLDSGTTGCNETPVNFTSLTPNFIAQNTQQSGQTIFLNEGFTAFTINNFVNQFGQYCSFIGIDEKSAVSPLTIFPNPGNNHLQISNQSTQSQTIVMTDLLGKVVFRKMIMGNMPYTIDTSPFAAGIYHIRYSNDEASGSLRWAKE